MKILFYLLALTVILGSCKPEWTGNKKLDGEWTLTSSNGQAIPSTYSEIVTFSKKGSGGDVTTTVVENGLSTTATGIYTLLKNSTITFAYPNGNITGYPYDTAVFDINEYTKTTLKLTNQKDGTVIIYSKN